VVRTVRDGGDALLELVGQQLDAAPLRRFLKGLREEAVIKPNHAMAKVRYVFTNSGVVLVESTVNARVIALYLHGPGLVSEQGYLGDLPLGLQFAWTRADVVEHMRPPDFAGFLGRHPFDAWEIGSCMLRAAFGENGRIAFLALLPWRRARGRRAREVEASPPHASIVV
jgi:hypothetical protein